MGTAKSMGDARWACDALGEANDLLRRLQGMPERLELAGVRVLLGPAEEMDILAGRIQAKLLAADAAFQELQAEGGGE